LKLSVNTRPHPPVSGPTDVAARTVQPTPASTSNSNVVLLAGASAGLLFAGGVFYFTRRGLLRSPAQFASGSVEDAVANALKESGLKSNRLELEITERLLLAKTDVIVTTLKRLKAMGVSIVMDDFGTSYSSLSYLWKFRFDKIKIDRSFMEAFKEPDDGVQTVVKSIIELGREMKLRVTVEGVETDRQVDFLSNANADQVQGYYFGDPLPVSELSADAFRDFGRRWRPNESQSVPTADISG
jgi:predicted signal transduction protein with EAL and GGDEF domain